jgi:hypothetical protein
VKKWNIYAQEEMKEIEVLTTKPYIAVHCRIKRRREVCSA